MIIGAGGVGKTTLALHWLHEVKGEYEGQLFVDLRGFSGADPLPPDEPLERFLRALGALPESIPSSIDEQAALFRSMTTGRRLIVLLDNAVSAAQVRPLLPGAGGSLVVVTSRRRLSGLVVDGARFVDVDPLGVTGALELLERLIGADRIRAEREHARSLVALCGTLPLAVCASGARLAARRRWPIARAVAELGDEARRLSPCAPEREISRWTPCSTPHTRLSTTHTHVPTGCSASIPGPTSMWPRPRPCSERTKATPQTCCTIWWTPAS
ncbi:NB-ARC domain-containing protein [Actinomadura luteofluorescens]|uniref:NB-ARC domain-containing protein n=1 Tax=Actinomadura luteofluorescens TaxID=46163 RepID=UPI00363EE67B